MIKEEKKLIVVPRETPLSSIHLENMLRLKNAGTVILPAMPAFYNKPLSVDDLVDFIVAKILNILSIEHDLQPPWGETR
jgi:4-hydroxy-3-polyprenylbenzoate decarboxylase